MDARSPLWAYVFAFLELEDLIRVSSVCQRWWQMVFGRKRVKALTLNHQNNSELEIPNTNKLYTFIPVWLFSGIQSLNVAGTQITNLHLVTITKNAQNLEYLDISACSSLEDVAIYRAKRHLSNLERLDISSNPQLSILCLACLCTLENLRIIIAHGLQLKPDDLLFLTATFESISSGNLEIETADGEYSLNVFSAFEEELYDEEFSFF